MIHLDKNNNTIQLGRGNIGHKDWNRYNGDFWCKPLEYEQCHHLEI